MEKIKTIVDRVLQDISDKKSDDFSAINELSVQITELSERMNTYFEDGIFMNSVRDQLINQFEHLELIKQCDADHEKAELMTEYEINKKRVIGVLTDVCKELSIISSGVRMEGYTEKDLSKKLQSLQNTLFAITELL